MGAVHGRELEGSASVKSWVVKCEA